MNTVLAYQMFADGPRQVNLEAATLDQATRLLPDGVYTTFRTFAGGKRVLGLREHLERLYGPANPQLSETRWRLQIAQLCAGLLPSESRVRLIVSQTDSPGACYTLLEPFSQPPAWVYEKGVRVVSQQIQRKNPRLKSTAFISSSAEARQQIGENIYEVLLVRGQNVLEGMTSNFYVVQDGKLQTARLGILLGVTRRAVLRLARQLGLVLDYQPPRLDGHFSEALITSSGRGVVPVVEVDGRPVGDGSPGPVARQLKDLYDAYVERHATLL